MDTIQQYLLYIDMIQQYSNEYFKSIYKCIYL